MCEFHGSISEMGGVVLLSHSLAAVYLFVRSRVHSFPMLCVMKQFHCFNRAQWGIVDSWRTWSSSWQLGSTKGQFSAHWEAMLVYCCSGDTDLYVFNYFVCLNIIIFSSLGNSPHFIQLKCVICIDLQLGQGQIWPAGCYLLTSRVP